MTFAGVSTGRAGSLWIAQVMCDAGIPVQHEQSWAGQNLEDAAPPYRLPSTAAGEWSAQIVPYLHLLDVDEVFHQVRHPLKVIGSFLSFGLFRHPERFGVEGRHITRVFDVDTSDPLGSAVRYWVDWNRRCESRATLRWRVEDVDADLLVALGRRVGLTVDPARAADAVGRSQTTNRKDTPQTVAWADLPDNEHTTALAAMSARYGYA